MRDMMFNLFHTSNMDVRIENSLVTTVFLLLATIVAYLIVYIHQMGQPVATPQDDDEWERVELQEEE